VNRILRRLDVVVFIEMQSLDVDWLAWMGVA
jgi:hypothetical protein